jgi:trimeric autotransporter adhesin
MNTKAREQKAFDALVQSLRAINTAYLARLASLGSAPIGDSQTSNLPKPLSGQRTRNLAKASLIALACVLAGVGSALASGVLTVTAATGGEAIPAITANGAWTTLTGPVLTEGAPSSITGNGTIVLTVPAGFEFNPAATVNLLLEGGIGSQSINGVTNGGTIPVTVTPTTLTFAVTSRSGASPSEGTTLTYQNIQVRPTAGSPLASGNLTESGTCGFGSLALASGTWGFLREVSGSLAAYQITGTNYTTVGAPISIRLQKIDQLGNPVTDSTDQTLIFSGCGAAGNYAPTINGEPDGFTTGIPVAFDAGGSATVTLVDYLAETAILNVTDGTASSTIGLSITVAAAPASTLTLEADPVTFTYGSAFNAVVRSTDQYGNSSTIGLGSSVNVTLSLASGMGILSGALTQDLGAGAGNGSVQFTGLKISAAGTGKVLAASADGFSSANSTVNVLPLVVAPALVVGNKTYDGSTDAPIISRSLGGVLGGDDVTLGQSGLAAFSDKHVGSAKPVTITGLSLTGSAAANYQLSTSSLSAAADITPRAIRVAATPHDRPYDGTTLSAVPPTLCSGCLASGDSSDWNQRFADKRAGKGKLLIPSGSINDGNGGNNYAVTFVASTNGVIDPSPITVTAALDNKPYDGTTTSSGAPVVSGTIASGDTPNFSQAFDNRNAGAGKSLIPAGSVNDANGGNNYAVTFVNNLDGVITAKGLTVTGITASDKAYDGMDNATLNTAGAALVGLLPLDNVNLDTTAATGAFADPSVGPAKTVLVSGLSLGGADAGNYTLTQPTLTASITPAGLTVAGIEVQGKVYDGTMGATLTLSNAVLVGVLSGDTVTLDTANAAGAFADKQVGAGKPVMVSGLALLGIDAAKYTLTQPTTNADITAASLTVTGISASDKVYDGTTGATLDTSSAALAGVISGEAVTLDLSGVAAVFADANAGTGKTVQVSGLTIGGADAGNYTLTQPTVTANITPAVLSVSAGNFSRTYGAGNPNFTGILAGVLARDNITATYSTEAQAASPVGDYSVVPALSDPDNRVANYSVTMNNGILTILPAGTTVTLGTSQNPVVEGSSLGLAATVSPVAPAAITPTGSVQFYANGQPLGGLVALTDGAATLDTTQLSAGSNTLSAVYLGDANFLASSDSLIQAVQMDIQTVTILSIVPNGDGTATVTCQGVPDTRYLVQATPALNAPITWETVSTNTSGYIDGRWTYVDDMTQHPQRFFRAALP